MIVKLLPNYFKNIAITVGIAALGTLLLKYFLNGLLNFDQLRLGWILKVIILISLFVITFSKDKNESIKINELRLFELTRAVGFGGFILILDAIQELLFWDGGYRMKSGYEIMISILAFYLVFFTYQKSKLKIKS